MENKHKITSRIDIDLLAINDPDWLKSYVRKVLCNEVSKHLFEDFNVEVKDITLYRPNPSDRTYQVELVILTMKDYVDLRLEIERELRPKVEQEIFRAISSMADPKK